MCIFTNFGEQCPRAVRLCHVGVAAGGARPGLVAAQCIGGDDNDGDMFQRRIRLDTAGRLVAVEQRKLNVHEDDIGMVGDRGGQRLLAVADLDDVESGMAEEIAEDSPIVLLVLEWRQMSGPLLRLIRDAFAVRERLGDPRVVPSVRCTFLPDMPSKIVSLTDTPGLKGSSRGMITRLTPGKT